MHRLARIDPKRHAAREALPGVFPTFDATGVKLRKGQTSMLAAETNQGKSLFALAYSLELANRHGKKVLYFSADTDESDTLHRAVANVTGHPQSYVEQLIQSGSSEWGSSLAGLGGGVAFCFETDPTYQDLQLELIAHFEAWGQYPDLVVVDNLMDVVGETEDERSQLVETTKAVKRYARKADSHFMILAHCNTGSYGEHPPPLNALAFKPDKKVETLMTARLNDKTQEFQIAVVKGRSAKKDRTGETYITMRVDAERCRFFGPSWERREGI